MNNKQKKKLRAIGHQLKPVVTVAAKGLSDAVLAELNRALDDHELIKVKIVGDRTERTAIIDVISQIEATEVIQVVGGMALIFRPAREPNPALSNVLRSAVL